jgi:hypothetical protein
MPKVRREDPDGREPAATHEVRYIMMIFSILMPPALNIANRDEKQDDIVKMEPLAPSSNISVSPSIPGAQTIDSC